MMIITIFQATGQKLQPMFLSLVRKGGFDIPLMFIMNSALGSQGIPWATPISDAMAMICAILLFIPYWIKLRNTMKSLEKETQPV